MAPLAGLGRDERNKLRHALLNALARVFCDLPVRRNAFLHDFGNVGDRQEAVLLAQWQTRLQHLVRAGIVGGICRREKKRIVV